MSSKSKKDNKSGFPLKGIIISSSLCSILFFAFVAIFSALILKKGFAASMFMPVGLLLGGVSSLLNGFVTVFPDKRKRNDLRSNFRFDTGFDLCCSFVCGQRRGCRQGHIYSYGYYDCLLGTWRNRCSKLQDEKEILI